MIEVLPYGSRAILIRFEQKIAVKTNDRVFTLNQWIKDHFESGVEYSIPSYSSIVVGYHPEELNFDKLKNDILSSPIEEMKIHSNIQWNIPVCYESEFAPDRDMICKELGLTEHELIDLHYRTKYRVYSCGFLPGFPYLGKTDDALFAKRKEVPEKKVVKGSVGLAGNQTGIYPLDSPGGWHIIGRTPLDIFRKNDQDPFLFSVGDTVSFIPVPKRDFLEIEQKEAMQKLDINEYRLSI